MTEEQGPGGGEGGWTVWEALPPHAIASCWADHADGVLRLAGEIDADNAVTVTERILAAVSVGVAHLDLSEVSFFGAAGVRAVLAGHAALASDVTALQVSCSPIVLRVLHTCGLAGVGRLRVVAAQRLPRQMRSLP